MHFINIVGPPAVADQPPFRTQRDSRSANRRVNFAMLLQPVQLVTLGAFLDLTKELHRFGFVAWLAGVVRRDDHFNLDGDDIPFGLNQPRPFDLLAQKSA